MTDRKKDLETLWSQNVLKAKEFYAARNQNQMVIAQLAREVCDISWGGARQIGKFTLTKFAKEIGMNPKTLSNWIGVKVSVFDKLPMAERSRASFTQLTHIAVRVPPSASKEKVLEVYNEVVEVSDIDKSLRKYLGSIRSASYNFNMKDAAGRADQKTLQEYLFYVKSITRCIAKAHPGLKPEDHGLAANYSGNIVTSAASALEIARGEKGYDRAALFKDASGLIIRVTPKDRDVMNFLKQQQGKWLSPTEIGMKLKKLNSNSASAWSCRTLNKFVGSDVLERNNKGHYRWVGE